MHNTTQEVWDDLLEENVMEDVDELNFPGAVEADDDSHHRTTLINWLLIFICYWWTYCNIADRGIELMLQFLHAFFTVLSERLPWMSLFVASFPSSLYLLKKYFGLHKDCFQKFVVCPQCNSLYNYDSAFETVGSKRVSKKCSFVAFPNHRHRAHRKPCNEALLKEVKLQDGKTKLYPRKVYCYSSIIETLTMFLHRPHFSSRCELWRERERTSIRGLMSDVIHGTVWRDFKGADGTRFMGQERNLALMMNVDWFQPFKHSPYSVGVIYLAVMNLPRAERFKRENIIVVGILPGPHEPSSLNPFLIPVVAELKELWEDGIEVCHSRSPTVPQKFFAALLLVACDVPAARKLCGFLGHGAKRGCSKCKKEFIPGKHFGEKMNFGGFENCLHRTNEEHRSEAQEIMSEDTYQGREDKQIKYGTRYSELMQLEYFDCIRFTIIDPMHNLFLGTAKHMMKNVWLPNKILKPADLKSIQDLIDSMKVPSNMGRIPNKIASSFGSFTSDQWKLWTVVYSEFALKKYLPTEDYRLWLLFVKACRILTAPVITIRSLAEAHSSLMQFCKKFESLYGQLEVTPNMHLHSHLINCVLDYGPVHNFWLFSFERFNGLLGDFKTNQRAVEIQLMRKFLRDQDIRDLPFPSVFREHFEPIFNQMKNTNMDPLQDISSTVDLLSLSDGIVTKSNLWFDSGTCNCIPPHKMDYLDDDELNFLMNSYSTFLEGVDITNGSVIFDRYASVEFCGDRYGSLDSRSERSSYVMAPWVGVGGQIDVATSDARPAVVHYYFKQNIYLYGQWKTIVMARVSWFQEHPDRHKHESGTTEVWCKDIFEPLGPASFIPVQRIQRKFVGTVQTWRRESVLFVLPLERKIYL